MRERSPLEVLRGGQNVFWRQDGGTQGAGSGWARKPEAWPFASYHSRYPGSLRSKVISPQRRVTAVRQTGGDVSSLSHAPRPLAPRSFHWHQPLAEVSGFHLVPATVPYLPRLTSYGPWKAERKKTRPPEVVVGHRLGGGWPAMHRWGRCWWRAPQERPCLGRNGP